MCTVRDLPRSGAANASNLLRCHRTSRSFELLNNSLIHGCVGFLLLDGFKVHPTPHQLAGHSLHRRHTRPEDTAVECGHTRLGNQIGETNVFVGGVGLHEGVEKFVHSFFQCFIRKVRERWGV